MEDGETQVNGTTEPAAPTATPPAGGTPPAPASTGPAPVPYQVFSEANAKLRQAEAEVARLTAVVNEHGPDKVQALQQQIESAQASAQVRIQLARSGVATDAGMDYLASRYDALPTEGRPELGAWLETMKSNEPAFFRSAGSPPAVASPDATTTTTTVQPTGPSSPDATTQAIPSGQAVDEPLSDAVIKAMPQPEFERRYDEIEKWLRTRGTA